MSPDAMVADSARGEMASAMVRTPRPASNQASVRITIMPGDTVNPRDTHRNVSALQAMAAGLIKVLRRPVVAAVKTKAAKLTRAKLVISTATPGADRSNCCR
jgi:hypothetical protein